MISFFYFVYICIHPIVGVTKTFKRTYQKDGINRTNRVNKNTVKLDEILKNWDVLVDFCFHALADTLGNPHDVTDLLFSKLNISVKNGVSKLGIESSFFNYQSLYIV